MDADLRARCIGRRFLAIGALMRRRTFLNGCGAVVIGAAANAQEKLQRQPPRLPQAVPSPEPFAALREGTAHHLTPEQEMQRVVASPAPAGPPGRWESRASAKWPGRPLGPAACMWWADMEKVVSTEPNTTSTSLPRTDGSQGHRFRAARTMLLSRRMQGACTPSAVSSSRIETPTAMRMPTT